MTRRLGSPTGFRLGWLLAALLCPACGSSYAPEAPAAREARPLASIYDVLVTVPDLMLPQFPATGLELDLTLSIDAPGPDSSGVFGGGLTVNEARAGGVARPYDAADPLPASGTLAGADWALDSFGPIHVGDAVSGATVLMLSLAGTLSPDGRTISGVAVVTSSGETGRFTAVKQRRYLVAGTDFGIVGTVSLVKVRFGDRFIVERDLEAISGDPVVRASGGGVHVVNRFFFDNVQVLDPASGFRTAQQISTGNGSNPHDALAVDAGRLYVTRFEPPFNDLLVVDRTLGSTLGSIDLSAFATNDSGTPRADALASASGLVFVSLQNIDATFLQYGRGLVAAVDPARDAVVSVIEMEGRNPLGPPAAHPDDGLLYYAMAGIFSGSLPQDLSGGVEVLDPATLTTRGLLVDDDDLGGNVSSVALAATPGRVAGFCVVTTAAGSNMVRSFDAGTGAIDSWSWQSGFFLPEVVADGDGYILVPERDLARPGLVVLDASTRSTVARIGLSLPPFSVAVLPTGLPPAAGGGGP